MSRARDYRRGKDGRAEDRFAGRKRRYQPLLRALGLEQAFARMPRRFQEGLWWAKFPDTVVQYDDAIPPHVRRAVEQWMARATTEIEDVHGGKTAIPSRDFTSVLYGLKMCVQGTATRGMPPAVVDFLAKAKPLLAATYDRHFIQGHANLGLYAQAGLVEHSRADGRILGLRVDWHVLDNQKVQCRFVATSDAPQRERVTLDGEPRPAYRVGMWSAPNGIEWVSWPAREMGIGRQERLPVFVQSHALRHLRERMDDGIWAEYHLAESLHNPVIVERQRGGDLLVEYRVQNYRAGYLVISRAGGKLVARTFLFLTMAGTPEGDRLHRKIRLTRDEAAWLSLHRLSSFTKTDLRQDAQLQDILAKCGCGHLVEMRLDDDVSPLREGYAADVRRYLNMPPARLVGLGTEGAAREVGEGGGGVDADEDDAGEGQPASMREAA